MNISISPVGSLHVTGGTLGDVFHRRPCKTGGVMRDNSSPSQVDVVDLSSGETSRGPSMRHPRLGHAAAAALTTSLFVFGGVDDIDKSVEVFNPQTRQ